ncbi:hypothetical protein Tco_1138629 [Tanacetum coccineum]
MTSISASWSNNQHLQDPLTVCSMRGISSLRNEFLNSIRDKALPSIALRSHTGCLSFRFRYSSESTTHGIKTTTFPISIEAYSQNRHQQGIYWLFWNEIGTGGSPRCQEAIGGTIAKTRSERVPTSSYDSPLPGGNTPGSDEERLKQDDLMDFVPPTPHDSPLLGGHTPGSDKGRPNINELMAIYTNLSNRVLALETSKTAQDLVIYKLKKKVKRLENKQRARTPGMKLFNIGDFDDDFDGIDDMVNKAMENVEGDTVTTRVSAASASITTAGVSISTAEPRTPPTTTTTAFKDEDLTITQTLVKMRSQKDKEKGKGVAFRAAQEESARPTRILLTIDPKDKGKGIMQEPEKPP